jgi:hypothetical protein
VKTITVHIEDEVLAMLLRRKRLYEFVEGCVSEPSDSDLILVGIAGAIEQGRTEVTIGKKHE